MLTPKEVLFAENLFQGMSQVEAGRLAGYSPNDGNLSVMARRPIIQDYISHLQETKRKAKEFTAELWRAELAARYAHACANADDANALRALELAGKHLGLLDPGRDQGQAELAARVLTLLADAGRGARVLAGAREGAIVEGELRDENPVTPETPDKTPDTQSQGEIR